MIMVVFVLLGMFFAQTLSHTITSLEVPRWPDPRKEAELRCQYSKNPGEPAMHSVKWYRESHEIFRYTPQLTRRYTTPVGQNSSFMKVDRWSVGTLTKNELKLTLWRDSNRSTLKYESRSFNESVTNSSCDLLSCWIRIRPERGAAKYTCEVSSEGPRFEVDRKSANMTFAVLPEYDPLITGLPTMVQAGEQALINCTSDYSLPAATIDWFVDSEPQEDPLITHPTHISGADSDGLHASWRTLRVFPDDYATHRGYLSLRCRATVPTRPPSVRSMSVRLYVAARPHISTYMFSKNKAAAGCARHQLRSEMVLWTLLLLTRRQVPF